MIVLLEEARDGREYGGKAVQLGHARRAGLPVPRGVALSATGLEDALAGSDHVVDRLFEHAAALGRSVAVRSSAIGEDGAGASFAGQHATVLNVRSKAELRDALDRVRSSAFSPSALAYRKKLGLDEKPQMALVVQALVQADSAGVLFTRHPVTGKDERVIEGSWGLGEAVVAGIVTPDHFRLARGGAVLERRLGEKDLAIRSGDGGGTHEVPVPPHLVERFCLTDDELEIGRAHV